MSYNVNAKPCFLNGCTTVHSSDGSTLCLVCGLYRSPDPEMVNALLRAGAGGKEYRRLAAEALNLARVSTPAPIPPAEPPLYIAADTSTDLPSLWVVLPTCLLLGFILGLALWRLGQVCGIL